MPFPPVIREAISRQFGEEKVNVAAQALEQSVLETKDKEQLLAISKALGVKVTARSKKADIIDAILATTGGAPASDSSSGAPAKSALSEKPAPTTAGPADKTTSDQQQTSCSCPGNR